MSATDKPIHRSAADNSATNEQPAWRRSLPLPNGYGFQAAIGTIVGIALIGVLTIAAPGGDPGGDSSVPDNVLVAGVDVSNLESGDARAELENIHSDYELQPLTVRYEGQEWSPALAEIGARINYERMMREAVEQPGLLSRARGILPGENWRQVPTYISFTDEQLDEYIRGIANEIKRDSTLPQLAMNNGDLIIESPEPGVSVIEEALHSEIRNAVSNRNQNTIDVPVEIHKDEFTRQELNDAVAILERAVEAPTLLWFEDNEWSIEPSSLVEMLRLDLHQGAPEGDRLRIEINDEPLQEHMLSLITGQVYRPARNATVAWGDSSVVATSPSQTGVELDLPTMMDRLKAAILQGERSVELAVHYVEPDITSDNLDALGIRGRIATGESAFWNSSPDREQNISVAAQHINGTLIPPGYEFSFNDAVGPITLERGFTDGYVIEAEETVNGIGGGVCQVSTTVFRAAFYSGMPITERNAHAYIVGYYEAGGWPVGFDAAIYNPGVDFRFVNTTESHMLLHAWVSDGSIYVTLYGDDPGYDVTLHEPVISNEQEPPEDVEVVDPDLAPGERVQTEWAKPGMDVTLQRTVSRDGEVVREDHFYSNFRAWANHYSVGTTGGSTN